MRSFYILICLFLALNVTFTATAVSISDGGVVTNFATGEITEGQKSGRFATRSPDVEDVYDPFRVTENSSMLKAGAPLIFSLADG